MISIPRRLLQFALLLFVATGLCPAQQWSGILASSRAIDWSKAGLPATFPDGETTPNPWTPPARTQCGSTVPAGTSFATINSDLAGCAAGTYLLLGAGTFSGTTTITLGSQNNVTLRGSGADKTTIQCSGTCTIALSNPSSGGASYSWTSGLSQGSTTIGFGSAPGSVTNDLLILYGTSNDTDSGGPFVCSTTTTCSEAGGNNVQSQTVLITGCVGASCTISPGVYMPNWATQFSSYNLTVESVPATGVGVEDMTIDLTGNTAGVPLAYNTCYACWVKGNRIINGGGSYQVKTFQSKNFLIANNYFYGGVNAPGSVNMDTDSDGLIINNITQLGTFYWQGASAGNVLAYNYQRDAVSNTGNQIYAPVTVEHESGGSFFLLEGNEQGAVQFDNIHGTQNLDTVFRNLLSSNDPPYPAPGNAQTIGFQGIARFMNAVGNVLGSAETGVYQCTPSGCTTGSGGPIFYLGAAPASGQPTDTLAFQSSMRWGNWDTVTNATRWCGNSGDPGWSTTCASTSEVPTTLTGNAVPYENSVPSSTTLPASFFMSVVAHPSGGTGLSWWKVCTNYPTCSTAQAQPFPPEGPDVTGGGIVIGNTSDLYAGHANDIPAAIAWKYLPIDTAFQSSCAITSTSWSAGVETLNYSSSCTGSFSAKGPFQVSGANFTCPTFGQAQECQMTASTTTSVSFALASDPGTCSSSCGNFLYPDVRTFTETVYQNDPAPSGQPSAPQFLMATIERR